MKLYQARTALDVHSTPGLTEHLRYIEDHFEETSHPIFHSIGIAAIVSHTNMPTVGNYPNLRQHAKQQEANLEAVAKIRATLDIRQSLE